MSFGNELSQDYTQIDKYHKNQRTNKEPKFGKILFYRKELDFDLKKNSLRKTSQIKFWHQEPMSSTCPLTGFFWLLSHVIYLKLTRVLLDCLLSQAEWWVAELLFLSLNNWGLNFCKMNALNSLRFISHQKNWEKCLFFNLANFWRIELTKTSILPNCQVPNSLFW